MPEASSPLSLRRFCLLLYHQRRRDRWDDNPSQWGEKLNPWLAVLQWIEMKSGLMASAVEGYVLACGRQKKPDTYIARELHRWWNHEGGHALVAEFSRVYPNVAAEMSLPTTTANIPGRERGSKKRRAAKELTPKQKLVCYYRDDLSLTFAECAERGGWRSPQAAEAVYRRAKHNPAYKHRSKGLRGLRALHDNIADKQAKRPDELASD